MLHAGQPELVGKIRPCIHRRGAWRENLHNNDWIWRRDRVIRDWWTAIDQGVGLVVRIIADLDRHAIRECLAFQASLSDFAIQRAPDAGLGSDVRPSLRRDGDDFAVDALRRDRRNRTFREMRFTIPPSTGYDAAQYPSGKLAACPTVLRS